MKIDIAIINVKYREGECPEKYFAASCNLVAKVSV